MNELIDKTCGTNNGYRKHYKKGEKPCEECKKAHAQSNKEWDQKNIEKNRIYKKKWVENNREKDKESKANWVKNNLEKSRSVKRTSERKRRSVYSENYTEQEVLDKYGKNCYLCFKEINLSSPRRTGRKGWQEGLHIDHFIPLSKGGTDTIDNVRPAHALCNIKKGDKING